MTLQQLKTKADAALVTIWQEIVQREQAYFAKNGAYFGFNWSPKDPIIDGVDTPFVIELPSRNIIIEDVTFPSFDVPFQIRVIRHEGPDGHGFTGWVRAELPNGDVYTRSKGFGSYGEDNAWQKVISIEQHGIA